MVYKRGFVANVVVKRSGSNLVADAASGASELWVSNVSDFKIEGGSLTIEDGSGQIWGYDSVDPIAVYTPGVEPEYKHKITLSGTLSDDQVIDTPVLVWPPAERKYAYVELGQAGTNIRVEIPFSMSEKFPEGLREIDEREAVAIEDREGVWQIVHVVDKIPMIPGSSIDIGDSGIVTDPETPPIASPLPQVDAGSGAAVVRWVNAELAIQYDLYVSTTNSVAPGPSSLHTVNVHSPVWVATMPDGTALPTDSDVYFALVASNALGSAPASAWVPGRAGVIKDTILSASVAFIQTVITELVETQGLQIGDHTWNQTTGLTIPDVVNFPPDGGSAALAQIWAKMIARSLTVEDFLNIRGANNEFAASSVTRLSQGTTNPVVAPTVSQAWPIDTVGALAVKGSKTRVAGDPTWTGSGSRYAVVSTDGKSLRVWENGVAVGNIWNVSPEDELVDEVIRSVCKGDNCWWVASVELGNNTRIKLYKIASTLPSSNGYTTMSNLLSGDSIPVTMSSTSPSDGWVISVVAPLDNGVMFDDGGFGKVGVLFPVSSGVTNYREYSIGFDGTPTLREAASLGTSSIIGAVYQATGTDNPYGQKVLYIAGSGSGLSSPSGSRVEALSYNSSTKVFTSVDRYNLSNGMQGTSLTWAGDATDPDGALLASLAQEAAEMPVRVTKYSKYMNWSSHEFMYTWYDNDSGGTGTHETASSPIYTNPAGTDQSAKMARSWMLVTPSPANDLGGTDDPNSHRIYCSSTVGGTKRLQGATGSANGTFRFIFSTASSTTPPVTNNFPGATPAILKSDKTVSSVPVWQLKGDGSGKMGPFSWDNAGISLGSVSLSTTGLVGSYTMGSTLSRVYTSNSMTVPAGAMWAHVSCFARANASGNAACNWYLYAGPDQATGVGAVQVAVGRSHNHGSGAFDLSHALSGMVRVTPGQTLYIWVDGAWDSGGVSVSPGQTYMNVQFLTT